jgi:hypothetical protein
MQWLIDASNRSLRLEDDATLLFAIARFAVHLAEADELDDAGDLLLALRRFNTSTQFRDTLLPLLADGDLSQDAIRRAFERFVAATGAMDFPPEYRLLGCRLGALDDPACGRHRGQLTWLVIDRPGAAAPAVLDDLRLDVGGQARQQISLLVAPPLPAGLSETPDASLLRIGFAGSLEGSLGAGLPIRLGSIDASSGARGRYAVDYYLSRRNRPLVAQLLGKFLSSAPSPFDLPSLSKQFQEHRLLGLSIRADGELRAGLALKVGHSLELIRDAGKVLGASAGPLAGIGGEASAAIDLQLDESGSYELLVQPAAEATEPDADGLAAAPGWPEDAVRVRLRRREDSSRATRSALRVGIDTGDAFEALRSRLLTGIHGIDILLQQFQGLLPASRPLNARLRQDLARQLEDPLLAGLIARLLGQTGSANLTALLGERLARAADRLEGFWLQRADMASAELVRRVLSLRAMPLDPTERERLRQVLEPIVQDVVEQLHAQLRKQIESTLEDGPDSAGADALIAALRRVGDPIAELVDDGVSRVDALDAAARRALQGLQRSLAATTDALVQARATRIGAELRAEHRRSLGRGLDLVVDLDPEHPEAAELYRELITGSLEGVFASVAEHGAGTGAILGATGQLARLAGIEKRSGVDVAILGVGAGARQLFSGQVEVSTDMGGHVQVRGRGQSSATIRILGEARSIGAVSAFEVATAALAGRFSLGLTLSHRDDDLDPEDVEAFFGSLEDTRIGLLPRGTSRTAGERIRALSAQEPAAPKAGELKVWLELNDAELLLLLQIDDPEAGLAGNGFSARMVRTTAIDAIVDGMLVAGKRTTLRNMERLIRRADLGTDLRSGIHAIAAGRRPMDIETFSPEGNLLNRLERVGQRARGLGELIGRMRQLYFSGQGVETGRWDESRYLRQQRRIDEILQFWFTAEPEDNLAFHRLLHKGQLMNPKVRPHSLALFRAFKQLAGDDGIGREAAPLLASILIPNAVAGGPTRELVLV